MNTKNLTYLSLAIIIVILVLAASVIYTNLNHGYLLLRLYQFNQIEALVSLSKNSILLAGSKFEGNLTSGVAGIYYLNNNTFVPLDLGNAFKKGAIHAAAYNGSYILLAGTEYVGNEAEPAVYIYHNGEIINYSSLLSFYRPGQVFAAAWFNNSWFLGGNFVFFASQGSIPVMFLTAIHGNKSIDFTQNISRDLAQVPEGEVLTLIPTNSELFIGGMFALYTAAFILNGTTLNVNVSSQLYKTVGAIFSATNFKGQWIIGGDYYTEQSVESNNPYPLPYLAVLSNNTVHQINLNYQIGIITAITSNNNHIAISIRIPFQNSQGITGGTTILYGNSLSSLSPIYQAANISISQLVFIGNSLVSVGYNIIKNDSVGIILIYKV